MNRYAALASFVVAAIGAVLLVLYLRRFEAEKSGGEPVKVLVLTKALARGKAVSDDILGVREVPIAYVDNRVVKLTEREKVIGLRTSASLDAQDILMWNDLAVSAEEHRDLSSLVTPGFRAVYIRATHDAQDALINPGDYVDVIVTLQREGETREKENSISIVLLQKVLVLANGSKLSPEEPPATDNKRPSVREQGLSLSLSLQDAQLIALATDKGRLSVALRNPDDQRTFDGVPDMNESALAEARRSVLAMGRRATGPIKLKDAPVAPQGGTAR